MMGREQRNPGTDWMGEESLLVSLLGALLYRWDAGASLGRDGGASAGRADFCRWSGAYERLSRGQQRVCSEAKNLGFKH